MDKPVSSHKLAKKQDVSKKQRAAEGWIVGGSGQDCLQACTAISLQCTEAAQEAHNFEVDSDTEIDNLLSQLGEPACYWHSHTFGVNGNVANFAPHVGVDFFGQQKVCTQALCCVCVCVYVCVPHPQPTLHVEVTPCTTRARTRTRTRLITCVCARARVLVGRHGAPSPSPAARQRRTAARRRRRTTRSASATATKLTSKTVSDALRSSRCRRSDANVAAGLPR